LNLIGHDQNEWRTRLEGPNRRLLLLVWILKTEISRCPNTNDIAVGKWELEVDDHIEGQAGSKGRMASSCVFVWNR